MKPKTPAARPCFKGASNTHGNDRDAQFTGQNRNFQMVNVGVNYKFNSYGY